MNTKAYEIQMEIAGNTAIWTRPDTGDCPVSYPAPTLSATKAIFESVLWGPAVHILPTRVEICAPIQYHRYQTNYGGPLRKSSTVVGGGSYQLLATVLIDVCYKLFAKVLPAPYLSKGRIPENARKWDEKTTSPGHAYRAIFERRLKRGQCFSVPFLGWKEFGPSYFGPLRATSSPQNDINIVIPSMLREVFSQGYATKCVFSYDQDVKIINGVMEFPEKGKHNAE